MLAYTLPYYLIYTLTYTQTYSLSYTLTYTPSDTLTYCLTYTLTYSLYSIPQPMNLYPNRFPNGYSDVVPLILDANVYPKWYLNILFNLLYLNL